MRSSDTELLSDDFSSHSAYEPSVADPTDPHDHDLVYDDDESFVGPVAQPDQHWSLDFPAVESAGVDALAAAIPGAAALENTGVNAPASYQGNDDHLGDTSAPGDMATPKAGKNLPTTMPTTSPIKIWAVRPMLKGFFAFFVGCPSLLVLSTTSSPKMICMLLQRDYFETATSQDG